MNIDVIAVGKIKEKFILDGIREYVKRLKPYCNINIIEVNDEKAPEGLSEKEKEAIILKEGSKIIDKIRKGSFIISLCIEGRQMDSVEFARYIEDVMTAGNSNITFVIGGSLGLHDDIKSMSDLKLSFSKMTFPHMLMRLILVEQIYRAFKIMKGEAYHK
ncbi:23S rRNA (pseudouridine(1915)-N(3))-methyltransferase RlmH [Thermoanaerobacterium saccharolyticum]|uniref:Ribosomal RNA large subunit methyltransferase H n=2 Tax=Thermoanaerobacterium TaxID=28895 RepID=W9EBE4_9THEO|nr:MULTISPECIES: 23S rRNA (pseudouridine(1915)-N(3))-methyltransferase RlmH [Thermoanaerobacterium]AFK85465.1 Ribosomal RNA large subunit methyltransferase H [Thermoanaerobacterium saccharolyticum JW/SL-YS485]ETO39423.1 ribosomal RNA large subunit methyltransferase H [Thermoanaerobacterium aotearoense SCUT27]